MIILAYTTGIIGSLIIACGLFVEVYSLVVTVGNILNKTRQSPILFVPIILYVFGGMILKLAAQWGVPLSESVMSTIYHVLGYLSIFHLSWLVVLWFILVPCLRRIRNKGKD
jgi:hypothetical protein